MGKNFLRFLGVLFLLAVLMAGGFVYDAWLRMPEADAPDASFEIVAGESAREISRRLEKAGVISSALWFEVFAKTTGVGRRFQAGAFSLRPGMSYAAIASVLTDAGTKEIQITIPEGFHLKQIGETVLRAFPHLTPHEWQAATGPSSPLKRSKPILAVIPTDLDLEGYLFPDTYRFHADASATEIASMMVDTLDRRLRENDVPVSDHLELPDKSSLHAFLTLASIIEREVRNVEDMRNVADVFEKRLEIGMALQADSTVNYVTGGTRPGATLEDIKVDSPYNTYRYPGLPPGPISNPGMNAILAVLHPKDNPWYYFLTTPDGRVMYARTFSDHVENKRTYLR